MERREGTQYDFNDPLLETLLDDIKARIVPVLLLPNCFLLLADMQVRMVILCRFVLHFFNKGMKIKRTPTLGNHPLILEILAEDTGGSGDLMHYLRLLIRSKPNSDRQQ